MHPGTKSFEKVRSPSSYGIVQNQAEQVWLHTKLHPWLDQLHQTRCSRLLFEISSSRKEIKCQMLAVPHRSVKACSPCSPLHPYRAECSANCKLADLVMSVQLCWLYQPRGWAHSDFRREACETQHYQLDRTRGASVGRDLLSVRRDSLLALMPPPHLCTADAAGKLNCWYRDAAALFNNKLLKATGDPWNALWIACTAFWLDYGNIFVYTGISVFCYSNIHFLQPYTDCCKEGEWGWCVTWAITQPAILNNPEPTLKAGASFLSSTLKYRRLWWSMPC